MSDYKSGGYHFVGPTPSNAAAPRWTDRDGDRPLTLGTQCQVYQPVIDMQFVDYKQVALLLGMIDLNCCAL